MIKSVLEDLEDGLEQAKRRRISRYRQFRLWHFEGKPLYGGKEWCVRALNDESAFVGELERAIEDTKQTLAK